ncbi:hypothetical protein [Bacteroides sp. 519]|uniref:hypothetical protein n=1 Tax=Bacteroides sp. 519 TaxID=2302937 RepID=UPI0013D7CD17|nr:hypothetical protein [Bacteroides sp. 519]NDV59771.1 hypothetical protein [Bacteroides sp. 519]
MNFYTVLWPNEWVKNIMKNGDAGPLTVIYGGEHTSQPSLSKVKAGDVIYAVRVEKGQLFIMGRLTVAEIQNADEYIKNNLQINPDNEMWDSYTYKNKKTIKHNVPRTCTDDAALGVDGSTIENRLFPNELIPHLKLGPIGKEVPAKLKNGQILSLTFQGHVRRISEESAKMFDCLF